MQYCMQMAFTSRVLVLIFLHIFTCTTFSSRDELIEIDCLRSVKDSLEDPLNRLTWNFSNLAASSVCNFTGVTCWNDVNIRILGIELRNMGLKGQFPVGIKNCSSLQVLDLSGNDLSGRIPSDISHLARFLVALNLSNNRFSGDIPSNIANLTYLNMLVLDNNQLEGSIPQEIGYLSRIKTFTVCHNLLSGTVPNFDKVGISQESYTDNKGLCGGPLEPCKIFEDSLKSGFIVGYVISVASVITVFRHFCDPWPHVKEGSKIGRIKRMTTLMVSRKNKQSTADHRSQILPPLRRKKKIKAVNQLSNSPYINLLKGRSKEISLLEKLIPRMILEDVSKATNNFSRDNVIGIGQIGTTYKGTLSNGQLLAVNKLHDSQYLEEPFMFELNTLIRLRQERNIVQLLGFCIESKEKLLAYEYLSNGNLYDWLHPAEGEPSHNLEWPLRVKIATGVARGLAWLHHKFEIVHLDISSKCILLDQNFEPKLSNFRQAMYLNPNDEYICDNRDFWQQDFIQEDVHSFGLLLLELITGKEPNEIENSLNSYDGTLIEWIAHLSESSSRLYDVMDKSLIDRGFEGKIFQFLKVACLCVQPFPNQKPTMLELYKTFSAVGKKYGIVDTSEAIIVRDEISTATARDASIEDEMTGPLKEKKHKQN